MCSQTTSKLQQRTGTGVITGVDIECIALEQRTVHMTKWLVHCDIEGRVSGLIPEVRVGAGFEQQGHLLAPIPGLTHREMKCRAALGIQGVRISVGLEQVRSLPGSSTEPERNGGGPWRE